MRSESALVSAVERAGPLAIFKTGEQCSVSVRRLHDRGSHRPVAEMFDERPELGQLALTGQLDRRALVGHHGLAGLAMRAGALRGRESLHGVFHFDVAVA